MASRRSRGGQGLTQSQRTFTEHAYRSASEAGLSGIQADLAVAQAIHESAWGTKPSGTNNYHGIKGKGSKVKTHEIEAGKRKNVTASFRDFGSMTDSFRAWASLMGKKFSGVMSAKTLKEATKALRAGKPGGYATDPQYNQKIEGTVSRLAEVGVGPWGAGPAQAYAQAQYQRAMPPSLPAEAPRPSIRPGGLGALPARYTPPDVSTTPQQSVLNEAMSRAYAGQTLGDMRAGTNMPVDPRPSIANFGNIEKPTAPIPGYPGLGKPVTMRPGSLRAPPREGSLGSLLSSFPARPAGPVNALARATPTPTARPDYAAAPPSSFPGRPAGPVGGMPARSMPTPTARPDYASPQQRMAPTVSDTMRSPVSPAGPYAAATGPVAAPQATMAQQRAGYYDSGLSRDLAPTTPVGQVATPSSFPARPASVAQTPAQAPAVDRVAATPMQSVAPSPMGLGGTDMPVGPANASPAALSAARQLGAATAALNTPAAAAQTLTKTPKIAYDTPASAPVGTPAQAAVRAQTAARPVVADPWGGVRTATVDPTQTQAITAPTTFGQKLGNFAQRNIPAIAGTLVGGPVGGLIGSVLGRAFDNAQPGQLLGNPFQGLGGSLKALGMFQSGTPYAGPVSHYGTGLRAISDVLGGQAPAGSRAYSRSTPGFSVTSLPNGMVQKTNQYGFTSFERPSMGPTQASYTGFTGPGGVFGGGSFFGGGGRPEKADGKSTGSKSTGSKSTGGKRGERSSAAGY